MAKELTIPERLAWLLKERGVSQNALAKDAKVSPQTVANTLRHGRVPQSRTINKFARTLGVSQTVFDTKKAWTEADLKALIAKSGPFTPAAKASTKKPAAKKATTRKPAAKKTATKKAVVKKAAAKKPVAKKTTAKKAVAKKTVAKKPVAKKTVAAKKTATRSTAKKTTAAKRTTAKKPVAAKRTATKRVVAKRTTAAKRPAAKRTTGARVVRHSTTGRTSPVRKPATSNGRVTKAVDYDAVVAKLQKLMASRSEQVALDACKALLTLRG